MNWPKEWPNPSPGAGAEEIRPRPCGNRLRRLSTCLLAQHKLAESEAAARESLTMLRKVEVTESQASIWAASQLAHVLEDEGKLAEAEVLFREAVALNRKVYGEQSKAARDALRALENVLKHQGRPAEGKTP